MKKKIKKEVEVEIRICNICEEEVKRDPFNMKRIEVIRGLFPLANFDAHEKCVNYILKQAFGKFLSAKQ